MEKSYFGGSHLYSAGGEKGAVWGLAPLPAYSGKKGRFGG